MSSWSAKFKERMLKLELAVKDPETDEVLIGVFGEIHDGIIARMNNKRMERGLVLLSYNEAFKRGRGYVRKDNGKFMLANDAVDWASKGGYSEYDRWSGESIALRHKQVAMGGKRMY